MNKQIEEIKRTLEIAMCQDLPFIDSCELGAKALYDQGYLKADDDKVVLTKEELSKKYISIEMYELAKAFHDEKCAEFEKLCYDYEKLKQQLKQTRKETAREFMFKVEETLAYYDKYDRIDKGSILEWVGEIAKQCGVEI